MFADLPTSGDYAWSAAENAKRDVEKLRDEVAELSRKLNEVIGVVQAMQDAFRYMNR